jgi:hypothetical protein
MNSATLVDALGMIAGAVWLIAALYFQFICRKRIHPGFVGSLALIGGALVLGSAALAAPNRPVVVTMLAASANILFILLGLAASYVVEQHADFKQRQDPAPEAPEVR